MQETGIERRLADLDATKTPSERTRRQGYVVDCDGTHAVISADVPPTEAEGPEYWAVGQLVSIAHGGNRVVGQCFKVEVTDNDWQTENRNRVLVHIELVGEIQERDGRPVFSSGITGYPAMGSKVHRIRATDLEAIYENTADSSIGIGHLTQESSIPARIDLDKLLSRHFAVVGSTGVGKSTAVSLILRKLIDMREDLRIIVLDPHNEFSSSFGERALVRDARTLQLPFWLFRFAEFADVVFRGQRNLDDETEMLRDLVAEAKERFAADDSDPSKLVRRRTELSGYTADSPVPFRILDLMQLIDERLGQLDGKHEKPTLKSLRDRINSISRDPRFAFMFGQPGGNPDRLKTVLSELFRIPNYGKPICVVEMSALPSEVVNAVASVLCRLAFDLAMASNGGLQTLVVCEEAHRYIPANQEAGFWPTRQAVARLAKEGRKYGAYLGIITQRPSELDPTILSQCNTIFAMRLSNRADQQIIGGAITNGAQSTIGFLASIQNRECIAFGEAINTPMRMTFETIADELVPGSQIQKIQSQVRAGKDIDLNSVVKRLREGNEVPGDDYDVSPEAQRYSGVPQREPSNAPVNSIPDHAPAPLKPDYSGVNPSAAIYNDPEFDNPHRSSVADPPRSSSGFRRRSDETDYKPDPDRRSEANRLLQSFRARK